VAQVKCLIVTTHYRPLIGGALTVYDALASRAAGTIAVLTASHDYMTGDEVQGWRSFDAGVDYSITRLHEMRIGLLPPDIGIIGKIRARIKAWWLSRRIVEATETIVKRDKIDVVCIGAQDALGWLVAPLKKRTNAKVIIYVHGEEVSQAAYSANAERKRRAVLQAADALVAVSSFTRTLLQEKYGIPASRIMLQNNGVDLNFYNGKIAVDARKTEGLPASPFVFACGRLVERKGFDKLVEAWPSVVAQAPNATLLIGGRGPLEDALKQRVSALGIEDRVQFFGWMTGQQLSAAYALAEVFTMPNRTMPDGDTEGFGLVFLEAAAMGTPSVGGRAGGAVDAIIDGETGIFVDGNKSDEIAGALLKVLQNKGLRDQLAAKAQAHARTQGWQRKTDEFLAFLRGLTG